MLIYLHTIIIYPTYLEGRSIQLYTFNGLIKIKCKKKPLSRHMAVLAQFRKKRATHRRRQCVYLHEPFQATFDPSPKLSTSHSCNFACLLRPCTSRITNWKFMKKPIVLELTGFEKCNFYLTHQNFT